MLGTIKELKENVDALEAFKRTWNIRFAIAIGCGVIGVLAPATIGGIFLSIVKSDTAAHKKSLEGHTTELASLRKRLDDSAERIRNTLKDDVRNIADTVAKTAAAEAFSHREKSLDAAFQSAMNATIKQVSEALQKARALAQDNLNLSVNLDLKSRVTYSVITKRLHPDSMRGFMHRQLERIGLAHR